jgi:hypothetical protein
MLRDLAESDAYRRCCTEVDSDAPRLDEALRYPLQAIAESPESFPVVPRTSLRRARTVQFPGAPALVIYFRVTEDDSCCELLWIERAEAGLPSESEILAEGEQSA